MSECCRSKLSSVIPLNMNSYDGKLMFAAIISLLLVISFVLLLHAYARWVFLLGQSAHHRRRQATLTLSTTRIHHHLHDDNTENQMDGLDVSVIASIPIFVCKLSSNVYRLECVICLSVFEDGETGRHLPNCSHAFHVECIDRWLQSHSSCPICRALVGGKKMSKGKSVLVSMDDVIIEDSSTLQSEIEVPSQGSNVQKCSSPPPPPPASIPPPVQGQQPHMSYSLRRLLSMSRADHKVRSIELGCILHEGVYENAILPEESENTWPNPRAGRLSSGPVRGKEHGPCKL